MKSLILATIFLCLLYTGTLFAQNTYSIKGTTVDTSARVKLATTIAVMNAKDSILVKFSNAQNDGTFAINGLPAGKFLLLIANPGYNDYTEIFTLDAANKEHNFGNIIMQEESKILNEVTIKADVAAITIKGDTIEYNAKAYVIQPNDRVEDLLRQLPGITIDRDGHITAQGERVQKVLVDGEEFFGDDPTLVTRNIRADMVDKLQLYDAKSAQAKFTGIDDGKKIKTINVQLKEDRRTGVFGKADAGIGTDKYYQGQLIYNKFKPKEKFALYSTVSNNGKLGLGSGDNSKIGANDVEINDNGSGLSSFNSYDQLDNTSTGDIGIPESKTGGVHYDYKWDSDKQLINTNYKIGSLGLTTDATTLSQKTIGPGIVQNTAGNSHDYTKTFRQRVEALYTYTLSPTANLRLSLNATDRQVDNIYNYNNSIFDSNGALINKAVINQNSNDHTQILYNDMLYTKRFKKQGRTLSWEINEAYSNETITNPFKSDTYTAANNTDVIIDQYKTSAINSLVVNNNITYSEPITPTFALTVNYGFALLNNMRDLRSFNQSSPGVYNVLDSVYSSKYSVNQLTNQVGTMFNYRWNDGKGVLTFGTRVNDVSLKQINGYTNTAFTRYYFNWMPQATFRYRIKQQGQSINISYRGNNIQPTINQLQPITTNTNSQYITVGNPNLGPSFRHSFNSTYNNNSNLTGQFFSVNGNISFLENPIVPKAVTDALTGITTTTNENLNHNTPFNYNLFTSFSRKLGSSGMQAGLSLNASGSVDYGYSNGVLTKSDFSRYNINANISADKAKAYRIYLSGGPSFNIIQYSPQTITINNNSFGFYAHVNALLFLPGKFQVTLDFNDNYTGKTQSLPSINRALLHASIDKSFFSGDNLKLSLSCNNILNQDYNYRYSDLTTTSQTTNNAIKRYFMFTLTWNFTKFATVPAKNN
jgi:hypothetical protein